MSIIRIALDITIALRYTLSMEATAKGPRRVCAWCGLVMADGSEPATHGICKECTKKMEPKDDDDKRPEANRREF